MASLSEEAIARASQCLTLTETANNNAPWLQQLMADGGNPAHWQAPMPYCISAAAACWGVALSAHGIEWPFQPLPGTQQTYENAQKASLTASEPNRGDIVIYRDGQGPHGHAGIVTGADSEGIATIEFNTSPTHAGNQREGEGCYAKMRPFAQFSDPNGFHIRGYIAMSTIQAPQPLAHDIQTDPNLV